MANSGKSPAPVSGVVAVALLASLVGGVLTGYSLLTSVDRFAPETEVRAGDFSAWVTGYEWLDHDHDDEGTGGAGEAATPLPALPDPGTQVNGAISAGAGGYSMPASMMPGTPNEGYRRLQVDFDVINRTGRAQWVEPGDFYLEAEDGRVWDAMTGGTFRPVLLERGLSYTSVAAFDVEEAAAEQAMYLIWTAGEGEVRFQVSDEGHQH